MHCVKSHGTVIFSLKAGDFKENGLKVNPLASYIRYHSSEILFCSQVLDIGSAQIFIFIS